MLLDSSFLETDIYAILTWLCNDVRNLDHVSHIFIKWKYVEIIGLRLIVSYKILRCNHEGPGAFTTVTSSGIEPFLVFYSLERNVSYYFYNAKPGFWVPCDIRWFNYGDRIPSIYERLNDSGIACNLFIHHISLINLDMDQKLIYSWLLVMILHLDVFTILICSHMLSMIYALLADYCTY